MHLPMNLLKIKALLVALSNLNKSLAVISSMFYIPLAFTAATSLGTHAHLLINTCLFNGDFHIKNESMDPCCRLLAVLAAGVMAWGPFSWHALGPLEPAEHHSLLVY